MIFNETERDEREYLKSVIRRVAEMMTSTGASVKEHDDTLREYKDYLWSNKDIDPHEIRSMRESILNHFAVGENVIGRFKQLGRIIDTPYFGRIDFAEDNGDQIIPIYIGMHNLYDGTAKKNLIYDWRAPICGMFYDHEPGQASYRSPSGEVNGNISLKRQYRIRNGIMEYMIESSLAIYDAILQNELGRSTDRRMKNIVATIQREQNRIIRNENAATLIIQGTAGSGKTSIAMHRIAYLLYSSNSAVTSKDMLIISPNKVFADYISDVLPGLGEENVPETAMDEIFSRILGHKYKYQDFFGQIAELLDNPTEAFAERIRYKSTLEFASLLDKFIVHIENNYFVPVDVPLTRHFTVPAEYIGKQFRRFDRLPMRRRFDTMTDYILETAKTEYRVTATTAERNLLKKEIRKMYRGNNDIKVYKDFFSWVGRPEMFKTREKNTLEYPDLAPLAYLHLALEGNNENNKVKHLLIDEMQDYTPIQYKVVQKIFSCRKTLLGDACQSVNPFGSSTAGTIRKIFVDSEVTELRKSYRSTHEITRFAQRIKPDVVTEPVERHGERPAVLLFDSEADELSGIASIISEFNERDIGSLGIICKTEIQAYELYNRLRTSVGDISLLSHRSSSFAKGTTVTSAHMAKGLEFDEVIIPHADKSNYFSETDRCMLYVAATRAMHGLTVTHRGEATAFIE